MVRWVILIVSITPGLCLENAQGSLESWMRGCNCATWRWICDDLGRNILVFCWYYNYSDGQITGSYYVDILGNQVHPLFRCCFLTMVQFFKVIVCPFTQPEVFSLLLRSMNMHFCILPGQHNGQTSTSLNHCGQFDRVGWEARFPPPSSVKQLEDVFCEEWYSIPLETIQNLYESVPNSIQAVLQANVGPTPYW
jgi:hypothetical protein